MYANAKDAHGGAGHRLRARWYELRYQWFRSRMLKKAYRGFDRQDWDAAYAYLDWAIVGRWDEEEVKARTLRAIASKQRGYDAMADADWAETVQRAPIALLVREAAANDMVPPLQRGVPGNEPTEHNAVMAELRKAGVI